MWLARGEVWANLVAVRPDRASPGSRLRAHPLAGTAAQPCVSLSLAPSRRLAAVRPDRWRMRAKGSSLRLRRVMFEKARGVVGSGHAFVRDTLKTGLQPVFFTLPHSCRFPRETAPRHAPLPA